MIVQDDKREIETRELFNLIKPEGSGRIGLDAVLCIEGLILPFELKSTTKGSVSTARDFGLAHIEKWKDRHWLVAFYNKDTAEFLYARYGSPQRMHKWINDRYRDLSDDMEFAETVISGITEKSTCSKYPTREQAQKRARYLFSRGIRLNDPNIPLRYMEEWPKITEDFASSLRWAVLEELTAPSIKTPVVGQWVQGSLF